MFRGFRASLRMIINKCRYMNVPSRLSPIDESNPLQNGLDPISNRTVDHITLVAPPFSFLPFSFTKVAAYFPPNPPLPKGVALKIPSVTKCEEAVSRGHTAVRMRLLLRVSNYRILLLVQHSIVSVWLYLSTGRYRIFTLQI